MSDVVPAKVTRPLLDSAIERPRLFARLDASEDRPVVWMEGPPGAGKTTLATSYLASRGLPCLWYRIDATDHDLGSFLHHLSIAAKVVCGSEPELPRLGSQCAGRMEVFVRSYFRQLYQCLPCRVLVFDDCHEVEADSPLHEALALGMAELPASHRLLVLSRSRPPTDYARLQSTRALELVSPHALLLTADETTALCRAFAATHGLELSAETCANLHRKCEGWVTGLILMLEAWRTRRLPLTHDGAVPAVVFDYFASEILGRADPDTKRVLLSTAMLEDITAELAVVLSGVDDAPRLLDRLSSRGHFIVRHQAETPTWTCHQLFRQFLAREAESTLGTEAWFDKRSKAAAALEASGTLEPSVQLYGELGDAGSLIALLCQHAPLLLSQGRALSLLRWSDGIVGELRARSPWLLYWTAVARMPFDPTAAKAEFEQAFALFRSTSDIRGTFLAWAASVQNIFFAQDDYGLFDQKIREIEPLLQRYELTDESVESLVYANLALCVLLRGLDHANGDRWIERALALQEKLPDFAARIQFMALAHAGFLYSGESSRSQHVLRALGELAGASPSSSLAANVLNAVQALDCWMRAEFDSSIEALKQGLASAEISGANVMVPLILCVGAACAFSSGDAQLGRHYLARMGALADPRRRHDYGFFQIGRGWESSLSGNWAAADDWLEDAAATLEPLGAPVYSGMGEIMRAIARHHLGDAEGSAALLERARARAGNKTRWLLFGVALAEAEIALDSGEREVARGALAEGLALGRAWGFWNFTGWRREALSRLCAEALTAGIERDYTLALIEKHGLVPPRTADLAAESWPWPIAVRCLGGFELFRSGQRVHFSGKAPRKSLQLLELLVIRDGKQVAEAWLADALWPDADGDAAIHALSTTIGRLRQLLQVKGLLVRRNRCLTLDRQRCWVDAWALEDEIKRLCGARDIASIISAADRVIDLNRGAFIPHSDLAETLAHRARLLRRTVQTLEAAVGRLQAAREPHHARAVAAKAARLVDLLQ